jgi:hypothetical protein
MFDRLTENGRCYWMMMNVEKTELMGISRQPAPLQMIIDHSQLHNVEYFNYLGSMISNAARCTCDIWTSTAMLKQELSLHQQTGLKFKEGTNKVLHLQHNSVLYWNLDTSDNRSEIPQKGLKCGAGEGWRSAGPIVWEKRQSQGDKCPTYNKKGRITAVVTSCVGTAY